MQQEILQHHDNHLQFSGRVGLPDPIYIVTNKNQKLKVNFT